MAELKSKAEQMADKARELPAFKRLSLPGIKDSVAEVLNMIGRVEGIFSTYTAHDITHVDAMLDMLEWLIPPSTQDKMTPLDWLMIVLSIYLHDLGMVVTTEEYNKRMDNPGFCAFLNQLERSEEKDYKARVQKIPSPDERERFLYQEFIRQEHAARIKEWITGRHSSKWGEGIKLIATTISEILNGLPTRFKDHLSLVCESHHRDDILDNPEYFPLHCRYGSHMQERANVQYAALMLRTADLLHITKDRTPSIAYKLIGLTDPKSVDEWKKQAGTFTVGMKTRDYLEEDPDSHIIVVGADFTEERPYFALSQYLVYANHQISQSKRWADVSQKTRDGQPYNFPWEVVKGDIHIEGHEPYPMKFDLDRGRLLDLLVGHTIYNDPTVAVRELLQNAIDAVRYQHYLAKKAKKPGESDHSMGEVHIRWDPEQLQLVVEDNGIGMNFDTIRYHLMRVGSSFYNTSNFHAEHADFTPISRFGIGILTCFMISEDVEIVTCQEEGGYRVRMPDAESDYLLKKLEPGSRLLSGLEPHGTRVTLRLRSSVAFKGRTMADIIRYWIILPACKVIYHEPGQEPLTMGFECGSDAIQQLFIERQKKLEDFEEYYEVLQSSCSENSEMYELYFIVRKGFTPERDFETWRVGPPAVCIEGIRADELLPGFQPPQVNDALCAILSVRGNRRFRTTVSRTALERDDEYFRVAKLCTMLLFKHLQKEVSRIAVADGRPLSRASTAGRWIYYTLLSQAPEHEIRDYLNQLYRELPLIVFEELNLISDEVRTSRELISLKGLEALDSFWTVESRLVDYLGDISRDLGRELSVNDFLSTIAPDRRDLRVTPTISDGQHFIEGVLLSHKVIEAEFSFKNQQTLVKWQTKKHCCSALDGDLIRIINDREIIRPFIRERVRQNQLSRYGIIKTLLGITVAPITGDLKDIVGIHTRMVKIYRADSKLAQTMQTLQEAIVQLYHCGEKSRVQKLISLATTLLGTLERMDHFALDYEGSQIVQIWADTVEEINPILKTINTGKALPIRIKDVIEDAKHTFDASRYWMNWNREDA